MTFNIFEHDTAMQDFEYILGYMGKPVLINGQPRQVLITNTNLQQNYDDKKITSLEPLNRGDLIEYYGKKLMIISEQSDERYYKYKAIARLLPHTITINHNCTFIHVHCYIDSPSFGVSHGNVMSIATGQIQVHTQYNEGTRKIAVDDRFIFGGQAFKVTGIDPLTHEGIITFTCNKDQINTAVDDVENDLAGVFGCEPEQPVDPEEPNQPQLRIEIRSTSSEPNIIKTGQTKQYSVDIYNDGILLDDAKVTWQLYADDKQNQTTLATIVEQTDTSCTIKNNNATSGYVQLRAVWDGDETVEGWLRIQMRSLI